jgi:hypothetical protein
VKVSVTRTAPSTPSTIAPNAYGYIRFRAKVQ